MVRLLPFPVHVTTSKNPGHLRKLQETYSPPETLVFKLLPAVKPLLLKDETVALDAFPGEYSAESKFGYKTLKLLPVFRPPDRDWETT